MRLLFSFGLYSVLSTVLTGTVILNAYSTRLQFYSTVIHLVKSKFSLLILFNFGFVLILLLAKMTKRLFFGTLRASEVELLWENTGYAITETCLALTIFRDELNLHTYMLFTCLLFFKAFHWLCKARVEHLEQDEERYRSYLSQTRVASFILFLLLADASFSAVSASLIMENGVSVQLLFGFEFLLLFLSALTIFSKYILITIDNYFMTGRWYNKSLYEMYLKLIVSFIHFTVYLLFFFIVFTFYGIPIHLLRNLYISLHAVQTRMKHFLQFRRVTANLNSGFADATEEDMEQSDKVCVICREEMELPAAGVDSPESRIKKLSCGHIFHFYCLRNWFERQLKCPTCRADIVPGRPMRRPNPVRAQVPAEINQERPIQPENNQNEVQPEPIREIPAGEEAAREPDQSNDEVSTEERARTLRLRALHEAVRRDLASAEAEQENSGLETQEESNQESAPANLQPTNANAPVHEHDSGPNPVTNAPVLEPFNPATNYFSVNDYLRNQIDVLSLQLQIYSAQITAANATREAAMAIVNLNRDLAEENAREEPTDQVREAEVGNENGEPGNDADSGAPGGEFIDYSRN